MARVNLTGSALDNITGGAFSFYSRENTPLVYIDGVGTFYCTPDAGNWVAQQMSNGMSDPADIIRIAREKGLFWE